MADRACRSCQPRVGEDGILDLRDKTILVIGGAGFVGSHVVDSLLAEPVAGVTVFGGLNRGAGNLAHIHDSRLKRIDGSVTDLESLRAAMHGVDGVCLLASLWLAECIENPRAALDVNVMGAFNVMQACQEMGVSRLVYTSSAVVYGDPVTEIITEDSPLNNRNLYGATKIAAEQILRAQFAQHGLPYVSLRYTNVYGPRQVAKGKSASVLIRVLDRIASGQPPIIHGDGSQSFDFIDVRDVARAMCLALKVDVADEIFNISSGVSTSLNELVALLLELTGSSLQPEYIPQAGNPKLRATFSTEKASRLLGFHAQTDLRDGLRDLIHWRQSILKLIE